MKDERFLNYAKRLDESAVGQALGPALDGRFWLVREVLPPTTGRRGSRLHLQRLSEKEGK